MFFISPLSLAEQISIKTCPTFFARLARVFKSTDRDDKLLANLQATIRNDSDDETISHKLLIGRTKTQLDLGYITQEETGFIRAAVLAIKSGKIDEISTGLVVGPKVINLLVSLPKIAPINKSVRVFGELNVGSLLRNRDKQIRNSQGMIGGDARVWTPQEIRAFDVSIEKLQIKQACRKFWNTEILENCGRLQFSFKLNAIDQIEWINEYP